MSELFRELQDDIREENLEKLWSRFGREAIRIAVAVVIGTAVAVVWHHYRDQASAKETSALVIMEEAFRAGDYQKVIRAPEPKDLASAYGAMAVLVKANAYAALGEFDEANKRYGALASAQVTTDNKPFVALAALMSGASASDALPFEAARGERRAWDLLAQGKRAEAATAFRILAADARAPQSLRARAAAAEAYLNE